MICVTATTPTPLGEGKTVTAFGLGQALKLRGKNIVNTFRQPSKGPTFGIKGGATGGGYSQALPVENINLHFTGDVHAMETTQNLCAAAIDASILHGRTPGDTRRNPLNIDPLNITWTYCVDVEARALRDAMIGLGSVANGNNSVLDDLVALKLANFVVRENGFGVDCGFSKMIDVKCRQSGLKADCAAIVASVRAVKEHGGAFHLCPGMPYAKLKEAAETENLTAVEKGCENQARNIAMAKMYGVPAVIAINRFSPDTDKGIELVRRKALEAEADGVGLSKGWAKGGEGALELADEVFRAVEKPHEMKFLFPDDAPIKDKIGTIATKVFGADDVDYSPDAAAKIKLYTDLGFGWMTVNMAKTHLSLSHNPNWKGVPKNYRLPIRDIRTSVGSGFFYPLCGAMSTMPGFPTRPAFVDVDVDLETGKVKGGYSSKGPLIPSAKPSLKGEK